MSDRFLRQRGTGRIYSWDPSYAERPDMDEVTEEVAYPERFIPSRVVANPDVYTVDIGDLDEGEPPVEAYTGTYTHMEEQHFNNAVRMQGMNREHAIGATLAGRPAETPESQPPHVGLTPPSPQVAA